MNTVATNIKSKRKEREMTQQELADALNVSRTTVSNWETGRNYPDLETVIAISDVLEISLDILLKEEKPMVKEFISEIRVSSKRKLALKILIPLLVFTLLYTGYMVVMNVGVVKDVFFPHETGISNGEYAVDEWRPLFFRGEDHLIMNGFFWDMKLTSGGYINAGDIWIRVKDTSGNLVVEETLIPRNSTIELNALETEKKYFFEVKSYDDYVAVSIN
ncbi:helix-turn-helix domain-containing protein [Aureibacillus halotolerans]|uniref:DNA-binding XRE family transcriptional regulator n=1 Tax=Aureibacillus halotolerans TaxID=1508390 RepID=A0A4R6U6E6_9BACI|nr:helix-turn-helix domain-containing protein [Aureibacillus halotolerans]TDQ41172.1 DNA-binding XRE family transcriptional regulator [Aureibacillus halotolerans]